MVMFLIRQQSEGDSILKDQLLYLAKFFSIEREGPMRLRGVLCKALSWPDLMHHLEGCLDETQEI